MALQRLAIKRREKLPAGERSLTRWREASGLCRARVPHKLEASRYLVSATKMKKQLVRNASRRDFAKTAAAFATMPLLAPLLAEAQQAQTPPPKQSPALAEAYLEMIQARFGAQLSGAQFTQIKQDIEASLRAQDRLRAVKLKNSDEPDFIFAS
ncbi:MAG: hypothetical protein WKF30_00740 [Pyrinomonadaceae bacterium]